MCRVTRKTLINQSTCWNEEIVFIGSSLQASDHHMPTHKLSNRQAQKKISRKYMWLKLLD